MHTKKNNTQTEIEICSNHIYKRKKNLVNSLKFIVYYKLLSIIIPIYIVDCPKRVNFFSSWLSDANPAISLGPVETATEVIK